ncbi:hypothetical protein BO221_43660 [Archangium sp. Cb G35]|nr:hypothetical protein BO221_43660 [Archangium sp. Cb G35]
MLRHRSAHALFTDTGLTLSLSSREQRLRELGWGVAGARPVAPQAEKPREAKLNRFEGPRESWARDVPTYGGLRYPGVLPGVDLWVEEHTAGLEYGFRAERGELLRRVRLEYAGVEAVRVVEEGRGLEVELGGGVLHERGLKCAQETADGVQYEVGCRFADARRVGGDRWEYAIEVDVEEPSSPVVVDPVILWNDYLGVEEDDSFGDMVRGDGGELFVTGTLANGLSGARLQGLPGGKGAVVARLQADGGLDKWTIFGGADDDMGSAIALGDKKLYVAGVTNSTAFGIPANHGAEGTQDGFVAQLEPSSLDLEWIYLVGTNAGDEFVHDLAVGPDGGLFIVGTTNSSNFPKETPPATARGWDAFIMRLTPGTDAGPNAASEDWSIVFRGSNRDIAYAVTVDERDHVYVTGRSESLDLLGSPLRPHSGPDGGADAFIVKLKPDGKGESSMYIGGQGNEEGRALVFQPSSNSLLVAGTYGSVAFPGGSVTTPSATAEAFVMGLDRNTFGLMRSSVLWNTSGDDEARAITLVNDAIYLGGVTRSRDFPVDGGFDTVFGDGGTEGFVARVVLGEDVPRWSSWVGGNKEDAVLALQGDPQGRLFIGGTTSSNDLVLNTEVAPLKNHIGGNDLFVMHVDPAIQDAGVPEDAGVPADGGVPQDGGVPEDGGVQLPDKEPEQPDTEPVKSALGWSCGSTGTGGEPVTFALGTLAGLWLFASRRGTHVWPKRS